MYGIPQAVVVWRSVHELARLRRVSHAKPIYRHCAGLARPRGAISLGQ